MLWIVLKNVFFYHYLFKEGKYCRIPLAADQDVYKYDPDALIKELHAAIAGAHAASPSTQNLIYVHQYDTNNLVNIFSLSLFPSFLHSVSLVLISRYSEKCHISVFNSKQTNAITERYSCQYMRRQFIGKIIVHQ